MRSALLVLSLGLSLAIACNAANPRPSTPTPRAPAPPTALDQIRLDAKAVAPQVHSTLARGFVAAAASLPAEAARTLYRTADRSRFYTSGEAAGLPAADRATLTAVAVDEELFYNTKYGSPLAYARAFDLLGDAGLTAARGEKVLDLGYGGIGHLRMLAAMGFQATGVDVDPFLRALYGNASDQGRFGPGSVRLLDGRFPADDAIHQAVGTGYAAIISKNVLKRGYIHPERPADDRFLIHLGVDDETFLHAMADALEPGGCLLIYNICPALTPPDKPFVPWSDGRSPFSPEQFRQAGLTVLSFDRDDAAAIRTIGHLLAWDQGDGAMDLEGDLSVLYTMARKP